MRHAVEGAFVLLIAWLRHPVLSVGPLLRARRRVQIRSVECNACMSQVTVCPAQDAIQFALPPRKPGAAEPRWYRRKVGPVAMTCLLAYIFFGIVLYARVTNHWRADLPNHVCQYLVLRVNEFSHAGMELPHSQQPGS